MAIMSYSISYSIPSECSQKMYELKNILKYVLVSPQNVCLSAVSLTATTYLHNVCYETGLPLPWQIHPVIMTKKNERSVISLSFLGHVRKTLEGSVSY